LPDFFAGTKKGHLKLYFNLRQPHFYLVYILLSQDNKESWHAE
jgi:hypothetical protein